MSDQSIEAREWAAARAELAKFGTVVAEQVTGLRREVTASRKEMAALRGEVHGLDLKLTGLATSAERAPIGFEAMESRLSTVEKQQDGTGKRVWGLIVGFLMMLAGFVLKALSGP